PAAAFLAALVLLEVECLAGGDDDQELPEVFAVGELRELAALSSLTEAVEGAQGNVLLVRGAARQPLELIASQTHELLEVALPEFLRRQVVAVFETFDPIGDRPRGRHEGFISLRAVLRPLDVAYAPTVTPASP